MVGVKPSQKFHGKILCLLLLYFVQGIPYGFQAWFLPIYLRSHGMSLTNLGLFKILLLPWMLKVLWAPIIDRHTSRRTCIIWSLITMATVWALTAFISPNQMTALCVAIFVLNLSASVQDIAVDAVAVQILRASELGAGNTVQVVGYKLGSIFGGGVLIQLIELTNWSRVFIFVSAVYVVTTFVIVQMAGLGQCNINEGRTAVLTKREHKMQSFAHLIRDVVNTPHTKWMMLLLIVYKLGEQGAVGMFPLYLVDHGVPVSDVGFVTGVMGQGLSIAGSLAGGWMLSNQRLSMTPSFLLPHLMRLRLLLIGLQAAVICYNSSKLGMPMYGLCIAAMCLLQLTGGGITIAIFTLMMQCSQCAPYGIQATHYTTLATLEVIGKLAFMSVAGMLVDWLGYAAMFCLFVGLSVGVLGIFRPGFKKKLH